MSSRRRKTKGFMEIVIWYNKLVTSAMEMKVVFDRHFTIVDMIWQKTYPGLLEEGWYLRNPTNKTLI